MFYTFIFKIGNGKEVERSFISKDLREAWSKAEEHAFMCEWKVKGLKK